MSNEQFVEKKKNIFKRTTEFVFNFDSLQILKMNKTVLIYVKIIGMMCERNTECSLSGDPITIPVI